MLVATNRIPRIFDDAVLSNANLAVLTGNELIAGGTDTGFDDVQAAILSGGTPFPPTAISSSLLAFQSGKNPNATPTVPALWAAPPTWSSASPRMARRAAPRTVWGAGVCRTAPPHWQMSCIPSS